MPELLKCPSCQGNLELYEETRATIKCHYCDSTVAVPEHLRAKPEAAGKSETVFISSTSFNVNNGRSLPSSVGCLIWIVVLALIGVPLLLAAVNMPTVQQMLGMADGEPSQGEAAALAANATRDAVETAVVIPPLTPTPSPTPAFAEPVLVIGEKGTGRGQFENPRRLAVDNAGQVYVWDMDGRRVQVFDEAGSYQAQWPLDQAVRFLLADRQGHLYVLADELWRYDGASGQPLDQITVTTANGTISHFQTMAFTPQGNLVLSFWDHDQWIDYLMVVDREGTLLELWPGAITNHYSQDGVAKQLAVDREGFIYAFELQTILKFGPDGRFLNRVGSSGSGPGEWSAPQNIGVDGNGRLYIGEWRGIHVYDHNARFLDTIPTDAYVMDLAISDNNDIWVIVGEQLVRFTIQR